MRRRRRVEQFDGATPSRCRIGHAGDSNAYGNGHEPRRGESPYRAPQGDPTVAQATDGGRLESVVTSTRLERACSNPPRAIGQGASRPASGATLWGARCRDTLEGPQWLTSQSPNSSRSHSVSPSSSRSSGFGTRSGVLWPAQFTVSFAPLEMSISSSIYPRTRGPIRRGCERGFQRGRRTCDDGRRWR